jgi:hypothetical protein
MSGVSALRFSGRLKVIVQILSFFSLSSHSSPMETPLPAWLSRADEIFKPGRTYGSRPPGGNE